MVAGGRFRVARLLLTPDRPVGEVIILRILNFSDDLLLQYIFDIVEF